MVKLDFSNVLTKFCQISGCPYERTAEVIPVIENGISMIEDIIDEDKFSEEDYPACEYAAATAAVYRFVCRECTREKIICTRNGNAYSADEDFDRKIMPAFELEKYALEGIKHIIKDNGFLFRAYGK